MHDPEGVCFRDGLCRLEHVIDSGVGRELESLVELFRKVVALEVLHHHVRNAVIEGPHVENAGHVLVSDPHRRARLAKEPGHGLLAIAELRIHELDGDVLPELRVKRCHDIAHATAAEYLFDLILTRENVANFHHGLEIMSPQRSLCNRFGSWEGSRGQTHSMLSERPRLRASYPH